MREDLRPFLEPRSVAIIGASASPGKPGHEVIDNILANDYAGKVYLVNPRGGEILGLPVHRCRGYSLSLHGSGSIRILNLA